jgi:hypothetical protein
MPVDVGPDLSLGVSPSPLSSPGGSSGQLSVPGGCPAPQSWRDVVMHGMSTALAVYTAGRALAFLPVCLSIVQLPTGGVSHDLWSWAPLVLDLGAVVAVAAPVSFRSALDFARGFRRG